MPKLNIRFFLDSLVALGSHEKCQSKSSRDFWEIFSLDIDTYPSSSGFLLISV